MQFADLTAGVMLINILSSFGVESPTSKRHYKIYVHLLRFGAPIISYQPVSNVVVYLRSIFRDQDDQQHLVH